MEIKIKIPESLTPIAPRLLVFIEAMVYKLEKNNHKGAWEGLNQSYILDKLEREVEELRQAIDNGNSIDIALESADCANFAMMAADIAINGIREKKNG